MTAELDRFRQTLKDGVEGELESYTEDIAKSIVATLWNACDDERGRLLQENKELRAALLKLNAAANRGLDSLNMLIQDSSDPGTEALGARHELRMALIARLPATGGGDDA